MTMNPAIRSSAAAPQEPVIFSCWKDIARFFGKGVRTVQRWEALGLPVYRPDRDKNLVFADPIELRKWALRNVGLAEDIEKSLSRKLSASERRLLFLAGDIMASEMETPGTQSSQIAELVASQNAASHKDDRL